VVGATADVLTPDRQGARSEQRTTLALGRIVPREQLNLRSFIGMGTTMAGLVVVGLLMGWFVDARAHTSPVFVLVGLAAGIVGACIYSYVRFRQFTKD
jgi:hypothetical protein